MRQLFGLIGLIAIGCSDLTTVEIDSGPFEPVVVGGLAFTAQLTDVDSSDDEVLLTVFVKQLDPNGSRYLYIENGVCTPSARLHTSTTSSEAPLWDEREANRPLCGSEGLAVPFDANNTVKMERAARINYDRAGRYHVKAAIYIPAQINIPAGTIQRK